MLLVSSMAKGYTNKASWWPSTSNMLILLFNSEMFSCLNEIRNTLTLFKQVGGCSEEVFFYDGFSVIF